VLHHPRVLVVDDEPLLRELVADALRDAAFDVRSAANGLQAFDLLRTWVPRAIVLDLMMPQLDGIGFCERLRRNPRLASIPVLLLTAAYLPQLAAQRVRAQAVLAKPFEVDDLIDMVSKLAAAARACSPSHVREVCPGSSSRH
jgi:two-component system chemotaxis response regulator CheY